MRNHSANELTKNSGMNSDIDKKIIWVQAMEYER